MNTCLFKRPVRCGQRWTVAWALLFWLARGTCWGQELARLYDQAVDCDVPAFLDWRASFMPVRTNAPFGQTFVPALDQLSFAELAFRYNVWHTNLWIETLGVKLRQGGPLGPLLGSTQPVTFTFQNLRETVVQDFVFPGALSVIPGQKYFLEVVHLGGDDLMDVATVAPMGRGPNYYSLGEVTIWGCAHSGRDLWFREGIIIPEPGTWALLASGGAALWWFRLRERRRPSQ